MTSLQTGACIMTSAMPHCRDDIKMGFRLATLRMFAVCASIGHASNFLVALDSAVDNLLPAALPFLLTLYPEKEDADRAWEWIVSLRIYGLASGSALAVAISFFCGRKWPIAFGMTLQLLGAVMCATVRVLSGGIYVAFAGRFINGLGSGVVQVLGSAMMAEVPAVHRRGMVLATCNMWACAGEFFGLFVSMDFLFGNERFWELALLTPTAALPLCIFCIWKSEESPRHLVSKNKLDEAKRALRYYQISEDWQRSLDDMASETKFLMEKEQQNDEEFLDKNFNRLGLNPPPVSTAAKFLRRFKDGVFARPLLVAMFTQGLVHMDDWLWISYSTQVFMNTGLIAAAAQTASLLMAIPQMIVSITLLFCFDRFSRRHLVIAPTVGSIFCSLVAVFGILKKEGAVLGGIPIHLALPVIATIDLSLAAVASESAYAITPEVFQQQDRVTGTAIVGFAQNIIGGILSTTLLSIVNEKGTEYVLIPFVIINVFYVFGVHRFVPETSNKTFQEIGKSFSHDFPGSTLFRRLQFPSSKMFKTLSSAVTEKSTYSLCILFAQSFLVLFFIRTVYNAANNLLLITK